MNRVLESEINALHAEVCAGLADPKRILILYELADGPKNVTDLATDLKIPHSQVSRHLSVLRERGMVLGTRQGANVEYRLGDDRLIEALDLLRMVLRDHLARRAELAEQLG